MAPPPPELLPLKQLTRERMLKEMLASAKVQGSTDWKVLIMDEFTLRVMSSSCKMADLTDEGISLVEDLAKKRQPLPTMDAVYFIQPTQQSLRRFTADMEGKPSLYRKAHVYFSRPLPKDALQAIKQNGPLRSRLLGLKEMNLEYLICDTQGFVTDHKDALLQLKGADCNTRDYERCIYDVAARLATVFASLKEFPAVRYRAAKASTPAGSAQRLRDLVATKLASALWDKLLDYKNSIQGFPQTDSCDLIILDRSFDPITPIIHDWSYGGMCFDLLKLDGNKYEYETPGAKGVMEKKTALLDDHDSIWVETRHLFFVEAIDRVKAIIKQAQASETSLKGGEMRGNLGKNLSSTLEQKDKGELHLKISDHIFKAQDQQSLRAVGELEQGFVFGSSKATYKELAALINNHPHLSTENKVRLLMIYAATHPEKMEPQKRLFWMNHMKLSEKDMAAVLNLEFLGVPLAEAATQSKTLGLSFGLKKTGGLIRKEPKSDSDYELAAFYPALQDTLEEHATSTLSTDDYPYVVEPSGGGSKSGSSSVRSASSSVSSTPATSFSSTTSYNASPAAPPATPPAAAAKAPEPERPKFSLRGKKSAAAAAATPAPAAHVPDPAAQIIAGVNSAMEAMTVKLAEGAAVTTSAIGSWAHKGREESKPLVAPSGMGTSLRAGSSHGASNKRRGRRLVVFIIGGMMRSEIRVAHQLSEKLHRDVVIGSTSLDTSSVFLERVINLQPAQ